MVDELEEKDELIRERELAGKWRGGGVMQAEKCTGSVATENRERPVWAECPGQ